MTLVKGLLHSGMGPGAAALTFDGYIVAVTIEGNRPGFPSRQAVSLG